MLREKFFGVRLKRFPGWVRYDRVETSTPINDLIKLVSPMKRFKCFNVLDS